MTTESVGTYAENIYKLEHNNNNVFLEQESFNFYFIEDHHIFPKVIELETLNQMISDIKKYKHPLTGLRKITQSVCKELCLGNIQIKVTKNNNSYCYYDHYKKSIYLHSSYFSDILNDSNDEYLYQILIYVFFHELAHAHTQSFYNQSSHHDTAFLSSLIFILSSFLKRDPSYFYESDEHCGSISSILSKQIFLTEDMSYIKRDVFSSEDDLLADLDRFMNYTNKHKLSKLRSDKTATFSSYDNIDCFDFEDKNGVILFKFLIYNMSDKFVRFEFNYLDSSIAKMNKMRTFLKENKSMPDLISKNNYRNEDKNKSKKTL